MIYGSDAGFEPPTPPANQEWANFIIGELAKLEDEQFRLRMEKEEVMAAVDAARFLTFNLKSAVRERYDSEIERIEEVKRDLQLALADLGFNK